MQTNDGLLRDDSKPQFRLRYALLWAFVLFVLLDIGFRIYFAQPNLVLRNEGIGTQSMDYLFEQIERDPAPIRIAWQGASVMQGLKNVPPEKTYPVILNQLLRDKGYDYVTNYNLATAGNHVGDDYLLMHESIKRGAKIIPVALHWKLFAGYANMQNPILYKENIYYLLGHPNFFQIRQGELNISNAEWANIFVDRSIAKVWGFYRYRTMLFPMITKKDKPPMELIGHVYKIKTGLTDPLIIDAWNLDYEERNQDNIWKGIPKLYARINAMPYQRSDLSEKNPLWKLIDRMCVEAAEQDALLLFFFSPLNWSAVYEHNQYTKEGNQEFVDRMTSRVNISGKHMIVNMTDAVDHAYFTDFDHMNMNGHHQLAEALTPHVEQAIARIQGMTK